MRRHFLSLAVATAVVTVVAGALVHRSAATRWSAMANYAAQAEKAWREADCSREAVHGRTTAGLAFAHYRTATERARELLQQDEKELIQLVQRPSQVAPADAAALLDRWVPVLDAVRAGAHCRDARQAVEWAHGCRQEVDNVVAARQVANVAAVQAAALRQRGADLAAVELLLDTATFGADLMRSPVLVDQMVGAAVVTIATVDAFDDAGLRRLSPPALRLLGQGLQRLDDLTPRGLDFAGEPLLLANSLLHEAAWQELREAGNMSFASWRYGFSPTWAAADAVLLAAEAAADLQPTMDLAWPRREQRLRAVLESADIWQNPLLDTVVPNLWAGERCLRETLTLLRLLRLQVAYCLGDDLPRLQDPLGNGPIVVVLGSQGATFASAGKRREQAISRNSAPR